MPTYKFESDIGLSQIIKDVKKGLIAEFKSLLDGMVTEKDRMENMSYNSGDSKPESILIEKKKFRKCILKAWNNGFDYKSLILDKFDKDNTLKEIEKYLEGKSDE